jgi:uncharacterized protein involved in exopolysaccharide biosynthesis
VHRSAPVIKMPSLSGLMPGLLQADSAGHTAVEFLRARILLQQTIAALDLDQDPEFNPVLRPETVSDQLKYALKLKQVFSVLLPQAIMNLTADTLAEAMVVRNAPDTTVFDISVSSDRSNVAARIANFLAEEYIRRNEAACLKRIYDGWINKPRRPNLPCEKQKMRWPGFLPKRLCPQICHRL